MPSLIHKLPDGTEKVLLISSKHLIIGRVAEAEIHVRDAFLSWVHCGIAYINNQFQLKDLGSTSGTYRNGARVFECALAHGDKIQVGNVTLMFELEPSGNGILRELPQVTVPSRMAAVLPMQVPPRNKEDLTTPAS